MTGELKKDLNRILDLSVYPPYSLVYCAKHIRNVSFQYFLRNPVLMQYECILYVYSTSLYCCLQRSCI